MIGKQNRRQFIKSSALIVTGLTVLPAWVKGRKKIRFAWVTDIHYAEAPIKWGRYFTESLDKLNEAITLFNTQGLDFAIETGDFKDQTEPPVESETLSYLIKAEKVFAQFNGPRYHVLGNHDVDSISKEQFLEHTVNTGIDKDKTYYHFEHGECRFVVLDACFRSDNTDYDKGNFSYKDTNIPSFQLTWLKKVLKESDKPVVVFAHQLLHGEGDLFVNNAAEVRTILEDSEKVMAVFQGHDHKGGAKLINGILYYTLKALVEGSGEENNSYAIVQISEGGEIVIEGYRKADDYAYSSQQKIPAD